MGENNGMVYSVLAALLIFVALIILANAIDFSVADFFGGLS